MKLPLQRKFDADLDPGAGRSSTSFGWKRRGVVQQVVMALYQVQRVGTVETGHPLRFRGPGRQGLDQYIEKIMAEVLKDCPKDLRPKLDVQKHILRFPNLSTITFAGSDNKTYNHLRGNKFHAAGGRGRRRVYRLPPGTGGGHPPPGAL
jgi:hypothetical protein